MRCLIPKQFVTTIVGWDKPSSIPTKSYIFVKKILWSCLSVVLLYDLKRLAINHQTTTWAFGSAKTLIHAFRHCIRYFLPTNLLEFPFDAIAIDLEAMFPLPRSFFCTTTIPQIRSCSWFQTSIPADTHSNRSSNISRHGLHRIPLM